MKVHYLQHVPFEGLGSMEPYFRNKGWPVTCTRLYLGEALPSQGDFDWLIVMGGPMGPGDVSRYPWMQGEKDFIAASVKARKVMLGVCLGAQFIAEAMGAGVTTNRWREVGWFPVNAKKEIESTVLKNVFPQELEVFHWHSDTFDIPPGGVHFCSSEACVNQGFIVADRIVGLQFHLETTPASACALVENCGDDLDGSRYVQSQGDILKATDNFTRINKVMTALLDALAAASQA